MNPVDQIFEKFFEYGAKKELTLQALKDQLSSFSDGIVLYGAGSAGIAFYSYLHDAGINVSCFSDGDSDKQGTELLGKRIIPPEAILSMTGSNVLVIVTINTDGKAYTRDFKEKLKAGGNGALERHLKGLGCKNIVNYSTFRRCFSLFQDEKYNLPGVNDVHLMAQNKERIKRVYDWLEDDSSRETFLQILSFRMIDDTVNINTSPESNMYFEYDYFQKMDTEVFVDCGACTGSSLRGFLRENDSFSYCYEIEPDRTNFQGLQKYVNDLDESTRKKISLINAGVYSKNGHLNFFELSGPGTFASVNGPVNLPTISIDDLLHGNPASLIKMNIEGCEVEALRGATNTISTFKPRMEIMGYHKTADFWEVPETIKAIRPDYKLFLRSYMHNIEFPYIAC